MSENNTVGDAKTPQEAAVAPEAPSEGNQSKGVEKMPQAANESSDPNELTKFSKEYVQELRDEAAKYRTRAKRTENLEQRLHDALVKLDGRLQDASDLQFDPERLSEDDGIAKAITALIEDKPHLAKRTPRGDVGAGKGTPEGAPDLISIMRGL